MKIKAMTLTAMLIIAALALVACTPKDSTTAANPTEAAAVQTDAAAAAQTEDAELELTIEELAAYNGKDGARAYIAVDGVIYDVTDNPAWAGGAHNGNEAGKDATDAIKNASHGTSVLKDLPVVGKIK